jgi:hypothetical protein
MPRIDPQHPLDATEQRPTPGDSLAAPPSFILLQALNAIHLVCGNAGLFEELAKRRRRESDSEIAMLNDLSKAASSRINERIRTGKPTKAIEEYQRIRKQADKAPRQREPAAQTSLLRGLIRTGDDWCKTAEQALRDGGAERLDRALSPGTRKQSTRLGAKIDEMRSVLLGLEFGLSDQSVVIDQQVKQLAALGRFFDAQTTRQ